MKKITPDEATALNQNFIKTRAKAIDAAIGKKDAISTWFSLDDLKEYIAYVESEGKSKGITVNGLRVYFGAYAKNSNNPNKSNLSTVFFVPTESNKNPFGNEELVASSSDITKIDALNEGQTGYPPSATYPQ
ncbi:MAG: hypothetical protein CVU01_03535 [Bacteroidetes bacterium HGW-Bacteroidetes-18]|nr:MAG: hypothetical protein CVU01_03535 [Bacteroidetes bacterium HGW-Bacteroidetes-18]